MTLANFLLVISGTLTGLLAGLLYAFSISVIPALNIVSAKQHIQAMQAINIKIVNPIFLLSFLGPTVLLPAVALLHREETPFPLLITAAVLHIIGVNGVTIAGNVPLNDRLMKVNTDTVSDAEAEIIRQDYQGRGSRWMVLHHVRTLAAVTATALVFIACLMNQPS